MFVRTEAIKAYLKRTVCSKPGRISRFIRHSKRASAPYRNGHLDLSRSGALGDVLLCTPALRELKRSNPDCRVRFYTEFVSLVKGLPYIDEVCPFELAHGHTLFLGYEGYTPPRGHLARIIGDQLGVNVKDVRPDCVIDSRLIEEYRRLLGRCPRPHVLVLRRAGKWTPNKDWPDEYWDAVVREVSQFGTAIEIGTIPGTLFGKCESHVDLRGTTTVEQLAALVSVADLYVGPVSGPMHIAAAVGTPAVVIYGGYEHPPGYKGYEFLNSDGRQTQISLYSQVACSPCWRRDECPYARKCLSMIKPQQVLNAARELLALRAASAIRERGFGIQAT
jgi:ADP-heptose:LPS heptosyltransferase